MAHAEQAQVEHWSVHDLVVLVAVDLYTVHSEAVEFRNPFNALHRADQLEALLMRMFGHLQPPHFLVREVVSQNNGAALVRDFQYRLRPWQPRRSMSNCPCSALLLRRLQHWVAQTAPHHRQ